MNIDTSIAGSWLLKGHFDLSAQDPRQTTTQLIREELCALLGRRKGSLGITFYPTGMTKKHTFWWREGDVDYAEAQFFAQISNTHPSLSLGVSVEKGFDDKARKPGQLMNRATWDWPRLVEHLPTLLSTGADAAATALGGPINLRIRSRQADAGAAWDTRTFSFVNGSWFERHVGHTTPEKIFEYLLELDGRQDLWAIVHFASDLGLTEADGLTPSGAASLLMGFDGIRRQLRP